MKAAILAAGKGTRVRPLTQSTPKPMLPILGKPVMEILVDHLVRHDFREILVNTSYLSPQIESHFRDGSAYGAEMAFSFEGHIEDGHLIDSPVGSAGALRKIQDHSGFFDETFLVLCGDALIDIDLTKLMRFHKENGALATIAMLPVDPELVPNYGVVVTDSSGRVTGFQEKPSVAEARSNTVNTGIYVFEPEVLERIPSGKVHDIGGQLLPGLVEDGAPFYGVSMPFQWLDIGRAPDYYAVLGKALRGEVHGLELPGREVAPGIRMGLNVHADLSRIDLSPPVYIGPSAAVEDGTRVVGPSMIGAGCRIERGAHVERAMVFDYTRIGSAALVRDMMVCGDYCVTADGTTVDVARSDIGFAVADARDTSRLLTESQQLILDMLREKN